MISNLEQGFEGFGRVADTGNRNAPVSSQVSFSENEVRQAVMNQLVWQRRFFTQFMDKRRNVNYECGFPDTESITVRDYQNIYDREPLARKTNDIIANYSWQTAPSIYDDEDVDITTPFEQAFEDMCNGLRGISFYGGEEGNSFWKYLHRADILSGIGRYGVILLGIDDKKALDQPVEFIVKEVPKSTEAKTEEKPATSEEDIDTDLVSEDDTAEDVGTDPPDEGGEYEEQPPIVVETARKLLFMRVFTEEFAEIESLVSDPTDPRVGQPEYYTLTLTKDDVKDTNLTTGTQRVHWTRVVHIVDDLESSEIMHTPRLQVPYNTLYNLNKIFGGSAEMYYRGAFPGLSFETHPQLGGQIDIDKDDMRSQIENYGNSFQRYLAMPGMTVKTLAPGLVSPREFIDVQIEPICVHLECPKRIFMGSERGELSSNQDARSWYSVVKANQGNHCIPDILIPVLDRLIQIGVLPIPDEKWYCSWPDIAVVTDLEKADVAVKRTEAITKYIAGNGEALIGPKDYMVIILGMKEEEAEQILQNREDEELLRPEPEPGFGPDGKPLPPGMEGSLLPEEEEDDEEDDEGGKSPFGKTSRGNQGASV